MFPQTPQYDSAMMFPETPQYDSAVMYEGFQIRPSPTVPRTPVRLKAEITPVYLRQRREFRRRNWPTAGRNFQDQIFPTNFFFLISPDWKNL